MVSLTDESVRVLHSSVDPSPPPATAVPVRSSATLLSFACPTCRGGAFPLSSTSPPVVVAIAIH